MDQLQEEKEIREDQTLTVGLSDSALESPVLT
jgi:hypothetical protein